MTKTFMLEWVIDEKNDGKLIRDFLAENKISKTALKEIKFGGGDILINGEHATVRHVLKNNEVLKVIFPKEQVSTSLLAESISLSIVFEDEYLLVVNKPANMNTIPSREHPTGSLANALLGHYEKTGMYNSPHIITRLDRNTSGLVLIAKQRHIHHLLSMEQKASRIKREYVAFAEGIFEKDTGTIEAPIGRKPDSIIERTVIKDGQFARTHYHVLSQYNDFAHVKLNLDTGRTHQIRVHMAYIGHPLLGDDLYGGSLKVISRQALHCRKLAFIHPVFHKPLMLHAEMPDDMNSLIEKYSM